MPRRRRAPPRDPVRAPAASRGGTSPRTRRAPWPASSGRCSSRLLLEDVPQRGPGRDLAEPGRRPDALGPGELAEGLDGVLAALPAEADAAEGGAEEGPAVVVHHDHARLDVPRRTGGQ